MNPLMAKRKKSKPRQKREPVEIKSAEEQIREARDCAKRAACDDQRRSDIKRQRQKQQSEERDRKARDQAARNKEIAMDLMCHEVPDALTVLDPSKRAKPGAGPEGLERAPGFARRVLREAYNRVSTTGSCAAVVRAAAGIDSYPRAPA